MESFHERWLMGKNSLETYVEQAKANCYSVIYWKIWNKRGMKTISLKIF